MAFCNILFFQFTLELEIFFLMLSEKVSDRLLSILTEQVYFHSMVHTVIEENLIRFVESFYSNPTHLYQARAFLINV